MSGVHLSALFIRRILQFHERLHLVVRYFLLQHNITVLRIIPDISVKLIAAQVRKNTAQAHESSAQRNPHRSLKQNNPVSHCTLQYWLPSLSPLHRQYRLSGKESLCCRIPAGTTQFSHIFSPLVYSIYIRRPIRPISMPATMVNMTISFFACAWEISTAVFFFSLPCASPVILLTRNLTVLVHVIVIVHCIVHNLRFLRIGHSIFCHRRIPDAVKIHARIDPLVCLVVVGFQICDLALKGLISDSCAPSSPTGCGCMHR